jgi:hypothetical protein
MQFSQHYLKFLGYDACRWTFKLTMGQHSIIRHSTIGVNPVITYGR